MYNQRLLLVLVYILRMVQKKYPDILQKKQIPRTENFDMDIEVLIYVKSFKHFFTKTYLIMWRIGHVMITAKTIRLHYEKPYAKNIFDKKPCKAVNEKKDINCRR